MEHSGPTSAVDWLAAAAPDPTACRREWDRTGLAIMLLPAGRLWDVLLVPGPLGLAAFEVLLHCTGIRDTGIRDTGVHGTGVHGTGPDPTGGSAHGAAAPNGYGYLAGPGRATAPGPVLADFGDEHIGFFVPVGTAARWVGTGVRCAGEGTWIVVPHPVRRSRGVRWLLPPDGSGALVDPVLLELSLHEAAAGLGSAYREQ